MDTRLTRRGLLGAAAAAPLAGLAAAADPLPRRVLGRTGFRASILGIGMAPIGFGGHSRAAAVRLVHEALELGINYVDVAPAYADAEEKLGYALRGRREGVFLVTKVNEQRREAILRQIQRSLRLLQTDVVDAIHLHNLGDFNQREALHDEDGGLAALREARRRGYVRYLGISGHLRPGLFTAAIDTGEIDLVMPALNFVDRHTYNFEHHVLPAARRHRAAVVAMKVLGGAVGMVYDKPTPAMLADHYEDALRYALGLDGVSVAVIGLGSSEEIRRAVAGAQAYRPLEPAELQAVLARGKELAAKWGPHFGPVA